MENLINQISEQRFLALLDEAKEIWDRAECCPRRCKVKRTENRARPCGAVDEGIRVASFAVHDGEEPPVSGWNGAGNIFFSGCTLGCVFCQNWPISHERNGRTYSEDEYDEEVRKMLSKKVHNVNLVTSDHYLYPVLSSLYRMRKEIKVPVSYNCSGFFQPEALKVVLNFADIFLYDIKYSCRDIAGRYSGSRHYPELAWKGFEMLCDEKIPFVEDDLGLLRRGVIVRHLVLPEAVKNSLDVVEGLAKYRDRGMDFRLSLMSQYFPAHRASEFEEINRRVTPEEYNVVADRVDELGLDGWIQGF